MSDGIVALIIATVRSVDDGRLDRPRACCA
jgi:hypothetical protein